MFDLGSASFKLSVGDEDFGDGPNDTWVGWLAEGGSVRRETFTRGVEVAPQEGELISCPLSKAKKRGVVERGGEQQF